MPSAEAQKAIPITMTVIELAPEIQEDFDRILDHLFDHETNDPVARIEEIVRAIDVLHFNPLIGRPTSHNMRELVIGRRSSGYVALYAYIDEIDTVFVLAIRAGVEAGYARDFLL